MKHSRRPFSSWLPLLIAPAALALTSAAQADVPAAITEQGRLFDASGAPLTGSITVTFSIYAGPAGGPSLWTETQVSRSTKATSRPSSGRRTRSPPACGTGRFATWGSRWAQIRR